MVRADGVVLRSCAKARRADSDAVRSLVAAVGSAAVVPSVEVVGSAAVVRPRSAKRRVKRRKKRSQATPRRVADAPKVGARRPADAANGVEPHRLAKAVNDLEPPLPAEARVAAVVVARPG